jgi:N-acetylglucosaminyldiphosphoundecaprenol N-acetyl-beta-D-mannosaminyltransferase
MSPQKPFERRSAERVYKRVTVGGVATDCVSRQQMGRLMVGDCLAARRAPRKPKLVFAANGHAVAMAGTNAKFAKTFQAADIVHADGAPVVFASRLTDAPIPERSATTDFLHDAAEMAEAHGLKFFLLGATEAVNAACAATLAASYPKLGIAGRRHGFFKPKDEAAICDEINASGADVLWVGLGVPLEYEFCARNRDRLKAGWIVTCGGCFNFAAGAYKRAPDWMQRAGLEWLYRLWREPRRLFWRYAVTNPLAVFLLLTRTRA